MKIAVSAEKPDPECRVGHRFGTSGYFIVVDTRTMSFESIPNPGAMAQRASGIQAVLMAISLNVNAVLTGSCSPTASKYLSESGIDVITGLKGTVAEAVAKYKDPGRVTPMQHKDTAGSHKIRIDGTSLIDSFKKSGKQLASLLPILIGVILLVGLFNTFISKELLLSIFRGNTLFDMVSGTGFGSIVAGNPINSYVIGGELLGFGVSLFAVTAFIVAWVTVGLVQLPAEMTALGKKFALIRNGLSVVLSMLVSFLTVITYSFIVG